MAHEPRPRVFISCGQRTNKPEAKEVSEHEVAQQVKKCLEDLGFDAYVATTDHTLKGFVENIFGRLRQSEYVLFIDFHRPTSGKLKKGAAGGNDLPISLFSHQEVSLAAAFGKSFMGFIEGRDRSSGIVDYLQANLIRFDDRSTLCAKIEKAVRETWNRGWRDELLVRIPNVGSCHDASPDGHRRCRFHFLEVVNQSRFEHSLNTVVNAVRVTDARDPSKNLLKGRIEIKWTAALFQDVTIGMKGSRLFDAFVQDIPTNSQFASTSSTGPMMPNPVIWNSPARLHMFTDASDYVLPLHEGDYQLTFEVIPSNMPVARLLASVHIDRDYAKSGVRKVEMLSRPGGEFHTDLPAVADRVDGMADK